MRKHRLEVGDKVHVSAFQNNGWRQMADIHGNSGIICRIEEFRGKRLYDVTISGYAMKPDTYLGRFQSGELKRIKE